MGRATAKVEHMNLPSEPLTVFSGCRSTSAVQLDVPLHVSCAAGRQVRGEFKERYITTLASPVYILPTLVRQGEKVNYIRSIWVDKIIGMGTLITMFHLDDEEYFDMQRI